MYPTQCREKLLSRLFAFVFRKVGLGFGRQCLSSLVSQLGVGAPTVITRGQSGSPLTRPAEPSADHLSPSSPGAVGTNAYELATRGRD